MLYTGYSIIPKISLSINQAEYLKKYNITQFLGYMIL